MGPNQTDLKRKHKATQGPTRNACRSQIALMALVQSIRGKVTALSIHVSRAYSGSRADILVQTDTRKKRMCSKATTKVEETTPLWDSTKPTSNANTNTKRPKDQQAIQAEVKNSDGPGFHVFWLGHCDEHAAYMYHEFVAFRVPAS